MVITYALILFIALALLNVSKRFRRREMTARAAFGWGVLWLVMAVAVLAPQTTDFLAGKVGVGRGLDLVLVISVVTIFYLLYKIISKLEKVKEDITTMVRENAKRDSSENHHE